MVTKQPTKGIKCINFFDLMTKEEIIAFFSLPDKINLYRVLSEDKGSDIKSIRGRRWVLDLGIAKEKTKKCGGIVLSGQIDRRYVFAYFDGRGEKEVVVMPDKVREIGRVLE